MPDNKLGERTQPADVNSEIRDPPQRDKDLDAKNGENVKGGFTPVPIPKPQFTPVPIPKPAFTPVPIP